MHDLSAQQLAGRWIRCVPFHIPPERFPRMILRPDGTGVLEDGDFPAVYSIDRFEYALTAPTVIRFFNVMALMINDSMNGLEPVEPNVVEGEHDVVFHEFESGLYMRLDLAGDT